MSGNSTPAAGNQSTAGSLADIFAGALSGYVDSQNNQPVYVAQPTPGTAFGIAGVGQTTPAASVSSLTSSPYLILGIVGVVVAVVLLRRR